MNQFEQRFQEWLSKQSTEYLRELNGKLSCLHESADALSLLEIKIFIQQVLGIA